MKQLLGKQKPSVPAEVIAAPGPMGLGLFLYTEPKKGTPMKKPIVSIESPVPGEHCHISDLMKHLGEISAGDKFPNIVVFKHNRPVGIFLSIPTWNVLQHGVKAKMSSLIKKFSHLYTKAA